MKKILLLLVTIALFTSCEKEPLEENTLNCNMLYIKVSNTSNEPVNVIWATDQNMIRHHYLLPGVSRVEGFPLTTNACVTFTSRNGQTQNVFINEAVGCEIYEVYY